MYDTRPIYYVYVWYIIDTNEVFYVGKGTGKRYKTLSSRNKFFRNMYQSHNCDVKIIHNNLTEDQAFDLEKQTIKWYRENTNYRLTNQTDGGDGISGWKPTEAFKQKQSAINKKRWENPEYRARIIAMRSDPNGPLKSQAFRDKIAELVKGEKNPNYQHYWPEDRKEALRQKQKQNKLYNGHTNPNAKKIQCVETGEIFDCITYAQNKYKVKSITSFSVALDKPNRTAAHLHWVTYKEKQENDNE